MNSRENINLITAADRIRTDDVEADRIGAKIAETLYLKPSREHSDRWNTDWGTKTNAGLARTVVRILEDEGENFLPPKCFKRKNT